MKQKTHFLIVVVVLGVFIASSAFIALNILASNNLLDFQNNAANPIVSPITDSTDGSSAGSGSNNSGPINTAPPACTYVYSGWSECSPSGTQTRSVISSSPAGCVGEPDLKRNCTYSNPENNKTIDCTASCTE